MDPEEAAMEAEVWRLRLLLKGLVGDRAYSAGYKRHGPSYTIDLTDGYEGASAVSRAGTRAPTDSHYSEEQAESDEVKQARKWEPEGWARKRERPTVSESVVAVKTARSWPWRCPTNRRSNTS